MSDRRKGSGHTWSMEGFVLYNPKCEMYIAMTDSKLMLIHCLLDAYLFSSEDEVKLQIPYIHKLRPTEYLKDLNDPEVTREVEEQTNLDNWEIREAKLTVAHK